MNTLHRKLQSLRTGSKTVFVLLLMLLVVSGQCSAAMMPSMSDVTEVKTNHMVDCESALAETSDHSDSAPSCCLDSTTTINARANKKVDVDHQIDANIFIVKLQEIPLFIDAPLKCSSPRLSAEFIKPPLYYSLCVLRL